jgi:hypothetical protein
LIAIVDTGPLYALADANETAHAASTAVFDRRDLDFVIPALVLGEVSYLVGARLGPQADARFFRGLDEFEIESPDQDFRRIAELIEQYQDFPLGGTHASVVALAERLGADTVVTLDMRHFAAIQPRHCSHFRLLPE